MNPQELIQYLQAAQRALASGESPQAVDAAIRELTGRRYGVNDLPSLLTNVGALATAQPALPAQNPRIASREVARASTNDPFQRLALAANPNGITEGEAARMAVHGGLFAFDDELAGAGAAVVPGGKGYTEARDAARKHVDDIRTEHPVASRVAEFAGAAAMPLGAGGNTLRARMGAGALAGGLFGVGDEDGDIGDRAVSGAIGATAGAATAGLLHGAGKVIGALRTNTTARALAEKVGLAGGAPGGRIGAAQQAVKDRITKIQSELYKPLEKQFGKIDDDELLRLLKQPDLADATAEVIGTKEHPSLTDLQAIQANLRGRAKAASRSGRNDLAERARDALATLNERMEARLPGLDEANAAYREAKAVELAFDKGMRSLDTSVKTRKEVIEKQLESMSADARDAFRSGMAARLYETLNSGTEVTLAQLRLVAKPKIRMMFTDDAAGREAYEALQRDVAQLGRAVAVKGRLKSPRTWATVVGSMIGGGAAIGGARAVGLFDR